MVSEESVTLFSQVRGGVILNLVADTKGTTEQPLPPTALGYTGRRPFSEGTRTSNLACLGVVINI